METKLTRFEALKAAVDCAKSQSQFARDLGVSQPTVWGWLNQSKQLPAVYVLTVEALYGVSRHDLRPDIYPRPIDGRETIVDQCSDLRFHGVDREPRRSAG
ncbi:MAG: helix-turn-helix domain-containing protein [Sphingomonadaceae bacterium]|nr:helix-turn-helix domain-containing protein [Sphingomonadaceae bacterium]